MRTWLAGFCSGVCLPGLIHQLPVTLDGFALAVCAAGLLLLGCRSWFASGVCLGLLWAAVNINHTLSQRLPDCVIGRTLDLDVLLIDDPEPLSTGAGERVGSRFVVTVTSESDNNCGSLTGRRLRLSWHGAPAMSSGQRWHLSIRAKPPWGFVNPGGFDYERWLLGHRLNGTGYVKTGHSLDTAVGVGDRRESLRSTLGRQIEEMNLEHEGVLRALTLGEASRLTYANWELFRTTGTVHLMVISGLHVGLVAALGFFVGRWLVRLVPWVLLWVPARWWGASFGCAASSVYVIFTGGGLPAVRALLMVAAGAAAIGLGRRTQLSSVFLLALSVILLWEPLAIHQQGFWLSFVAVAALLRFFIHRYDRHGWLGTFVLAQCCLFVGLTPAVALVLGQVAWTGVLANLVVVPLVSFWVIPAALFGVLLTLSSAAPGAWLLLVADRCIDLVTTLLTRFSEFPLDRVAPISPWLCVCVAGCAWSMLSGYSWRKFLALTLLWSCWMWPVVTGVVEGEFRISALDVGQGSAIVVDTKTHRMLFDAGPRYPSGFDLGDAVVIPSLAVTGPEKLDMLILSHGDVDHAGGAESVVGAYPTQRIYSSASFAGLGAVRVCTAGTRWRWDGVEFEIHHPSKQFLEDALGQGGSPGNDASCVLSVSTPQHAALLLGDIGSSVERLLTRRLPNEITLMFAPHHGSRSSSSVPFVRLLSPKFVFVSAGRFNRYGHPHTDVSRRYRDVGASMFITGTSGALVWESNFPERVVSWRNVETPYWLLR